MAIFNLINSGIKDICFLTNLIKELKLIKIHGLKYHSNKFAII